MIMESELRAEIARCLRGDSSLQDLYMWLMSHSWNMHMDSAPSAVSLASDVEEIFFAGSEGELNDAQVLSSLRALFNNISVSLVADAQSMESCELKFKRRRLRP